VIQTVSVSALQSLDELIGTLAFILGNRYRYKDVATEPRKYYIADRGLKTQTVRIESSRPQGDSSAGNTQKDGIRNTG